MSILFLDIDGIVMPTTVSGEVYRLALSKDVNDSVKINELKKYALLDNISKINKLIDKYNLKIVIISSWRRVFGSRFTKKFLLEFFDETKFHMEYSAPYRFTSGKNQDIIDWCEDNNYTSGYYVLDDELGGAFNSIDNLADYIRSIKNEN